MELNLCSDNAFYTNNNQVTIFIDGKSKFDQLKENLENAKIFIDAGAIAVGLAGDLFPKDLVENRDWRAIGKIARTLTRNLTTC